MRKTIEEIGIAGIIEGNDAERLSRENSREYMDKIGQFSRRESKFKAEIKGSYGTTDDEADEIIRMFKNGTIRYDTYLNYPDIIRDKLQIIRQQKHTDI